ncbi:hypothetical protein K32_03520 [Kaistia sp. 32K]|nr:hypothetical protein K32_03520 [Kaistia sp. 32K]
MAGRDRGIAVGKGGGDGAGQLHGSFTYRIGLVSSRPSHGRPAHGKGAICRSSPAAMPQKPAALHKFTAVVTTASLPARRGDPYPIYYFENKRPFDCEYSN